MADQNIDQQIGWLRKLSGTSVMERQALRFVRESIGPLSDRNCLLLTGDASGVALDLCEGGGTWKILAASEAGVEIFRHVYAKKASRLKEGALPFKERAFDRVVIYDCLEYLPESQPFLMECHRVLKENGRLVVHVPSTKRSRSRALREALAASPVSRPTLTPYPATRLFSAVKDGFDVEEDRGYLRFFLGWAESLATSLGELAIRGMRNRAVQMGMEAVNEAVAERFFRVRKSMYPLLLLANALDALLFLGRGSYVVCRARRRSFWRPRRTPVLLDGRSIADATINTKIGTAGPFETGST